MAAPIRYICESDLVGVLRVWYLQHDMTIRFDDTTHITDGYVDLLVEGCNIMRAVEMLNIRKSIGVNVNGLEAERLQRRTWVQARLYGLNKTI